MQERYYFIDGLRGIFSVIVLLFHVFFIFFEKWMPGFLNFGIFFNGLIAVDIFFVLSGFSLSVAYFRALKTETKNPDQIIQRMFAARYFRLAIPCFCACLIMWAIKSAGLNYFAELPGGFEPEWWSWAYRKSDSNLFDAVRFSFYDIFIPAPFIPIAPYNGPYLITNLWTMMIEFIGSIILFGFVLVMKINTNRLLANFIIAGVLTIANSYFAFFFSGMVVADIFLSINEHKIQKWLQVIICIVVSLQFFLGCPHKFYLEVIFSSFLVLLVSLSSWTKDFFGSGPFRYLGSISFSLYLTHMLVVVTIQSYLFLVLSPILTKYWVVGISGSICVILSFLSAHWFSYIDRYAIRISHIIGLTLIGKNRPDLIFK